MWFLFLKVHPKKGLELHTGIRDLSLSSQVYIKSCGQWGSHVIPGLGKRRQTEPWGHWPVSLAKSVGIQSEWKTQSWKWDGEHCEKWQLSVTSGLHTYTHMCPCTHPSPGLNKIKPPVLSNNWQKILGWEYHVDDISSKHGTKLVSGEVVRSTSKCHRRYTIETTKEMTRSRDFSPKSTVKWTLLKLIHNCELNLIITWLFSFFWGILMAECVVFI